MSSKIYTKAVFGYREDTLENWEANNPVLEKGEPSIVRDGADGEWLKIGDGVTSWNNLPWKKGPKGEKGDKGDSYTLTEADKSEIASRANNLFSNALKGKAIGTNVLRIDDASPVEHDINTTYKVAEQFAGEFLEQIEQITEESNITYCMSIPTFEGCGIYGYKFVVQFTDDISPQYVPIVVSSESWRNDTAPVVYENLSSEGIYEMSEETMNPYATHTYRVFLMNIEASKVLSLQVINTTTGETLIDATRGEKEEIDLSAIRLYRYGKNLLPTDTRTAVICGVPVSVSNGIFTVKGQTDETCTGGGRSNKLTPVFTLKKGKYCSSIHGTQDSSLSIFIQNAKKGTVIAGGSITFEITEDTECFIGFNAGIGSNTYDSSFSIQIEAGETRTDYEPYAEPTEHSLNADGTVDGIKSLPDMTLVSNTDGVTVNCEYNRDINKAFAKLEALIVSL